MKQVILQRGSFRNLFDVFPESVDWDAELHVDGFWYIDVPTENDFTSAGPGDTIIQQDDGTFIVRKNES